MILKNKKTEDIGYLQNDTIVNRLRVVNINNDTVGEYTSLAKLNEEWEDYEEPKEYWYLENNGEVIKTTYEGNLYEEKMQQIGNYFLSRKEAEKAVEKLKAVKRLKDKGFVFKGINMDDGSIKTGLSKGVKICDGVEFYEDMTLLFGGEE